MLWDSRWFGVVKIFSSSCFVLERTKYWTNQLSSLVGHVHVAGEIHCHFWAWLPLIQQEKRNTFSVTCKLLHNLVSRGTQQGSRLWFKFSSKHVLLGYSFYLKSTGSWIIWTLLCQHISKTICWDFCFQHLVLKTLALASSAHNSLTSWAGKSIVIYVKNAPSLYLKGQSYLWDHRIITKTWRTTGLPWSELGFSFDFLALSPNFTEGRRNTVQPNHRWVLRPLSWFFRVKLK